MNADEFNACYPVGTRVAAFPITRDGEPFLTTTRTPAWTLGHGAPVVSVEGYAGGIALSHIDVIEAADELATATAAAVDALGALPMPVGAESGPLSPERLGLFRAYLAEYRRSHDYPEAFACCSAHAPADVVPDLLAEVARLRTELAKYVGVEPTVAEELAYLSRCVHAVHDVCDAAEKQASRWEQPLPLPEWVAVVREAVSGERPEDPDDRRRRLYIDGEGNAWIDLTVDPVSGERELAGVTNTWKIKSPDEVRDSTGGLREIGRCW